MINRRLGKRNRETDRRLDEELHTSTGSGRPDGMLRPPGLPHHRTCGFPHPAIGDERGLTREVVASCIAIFFPGFRMLSGLPLSWPLRMAAPSGRFGFAQRDVVPHLGLLTFERLFSGS